MPAYTLSFGGIELTLPNAQTMLDVGDFGEIEGVSRPYWTGLYADPHIIEYGPIRPVKLNRLYWPRGASKFAIGRFLVNLDQLNRIRAQAYTGDSRGNIALPFVMSDKNASITTDLYMLGESRPLNQWDVRPVESGVSPDKNLYVLTLVDQRYFWLSKSAEINVTSGQSWETLYATIAAALGISIDVDPVSADYLSPSQALTSSYRYLPPLLDAVAYSCGQRIVRTLDGSVTAQNAANAQTAVNTLWNEFAGDWLRGGSFPWTPTAPNDLPSLVPAKVRVVFPIHQTTETVDPQTACADRCTNDQYPVDVELTSLPTLYGPGGLYESIQAASGAKTLNSTAIAWYYLTTPRNSSELASLARQTAIDWYTWQAIGTETRVIPSLVEWTGEGANDFVEWSCFPQSQTVVMRDAVNDVVLWVFQQSTRPAPDHSSGVPGGGSSGAPYTGSWVSYITECEGGYNHRYYQVTKIDFTTNSVTTSPWIFESLQGCCDCGPGQSSGPQGSSGPPTLNECVTGTSGGIPWQIQKQLKMYFIINGESVLERTITSIEGSGVWGWDVPAEYYYPCPGIDPDLTLNAFGAQIMPDGAAILLGVFSSLAPDVPFATYVPMPEFGEDFSLENIIITPDGGGMLPEDTFCENDASDVFSIRIVGVSCKMPPPSNECIPGMSGVVLWKLPPEMQFQLFRLVHGVGDPVLVLQAVIENNDASDEWSVIDEPTHPCDGTQPNLRLDASAQIATDGSGIDMALVIRDSGTPIVNMTAVAAMPTGYGAALNEDATPTPDVLGAGILCSNNADDTYLFRLIATECEEQPEPPTPCSGGGDTYTGDLCITLDINSDELGLYHAQCTNGTGCASYGGIGFHNLGVACDFHEAADGLVPEDGYYWTARVGWCGSIYLLFLPIAFDPDAPMAGSASISYADFTGAPSCYEHLHNLSVTISWAPGTC